MIVRTLALLSAVALTTCGRGGGEGIDLARAMGLPAEVGAICGNPLILGERIADIGGPGSCGIEDAVRVHAVGKVRLSPSSSRISGREGGRISARPGCAGGVGSALDSAAGRAAGSTEISGAPACADTENAA